MQALGLGLARIAGAGLERLGLTSGIRALGQRALSFLGTRILGASAPEVGRAISSVGNIGERLTGFIGKYTGQDLANKLIGMAEEKIGGYVTKKGTQLIGSLKDRLEARWDDAESNLKKRQAIYSKEFTSMEPIKMMGGGGQTSYRMGSTGFRSRIKSTGKNAFGDLQNYLNA